MNIEKKKIMDDGDNIHLTLPTKSIIHHEAAKLQSVSANCMFWSLNNITNMLYLRSISTVLVTVLAQCVSMLMQTIINHGCLSSFEFLMHLGIQSQRRGMGQSKL